MEVENEKIPLGHESPTKVPETKPNSAKLFGAMQKIDGAVKRKQKRVNWVDEKRLGPLAAAEDGSAYPERGLGLTTGGQPWVKKRVRRLSVEGLHGTRKKCRFRGGKSWRGFASDDPHRASKRRAWEEAATAGRTEEEVMQEQQAIVQSIKELRAKRSFVVPGEEGLQKSAQQTAHESAHYNARQSAHQSAHHDGQQSAHQTAQQSAHQSGQESTVVLAPEGLKRGDQAHIDGLSNIQEANVQVGVNVLNRLTGGSVMGAFRQQEAEGGPVERSDRRSGGLFASTPLFSSNPFISNFMNRSQTAASKSVQEITNSSAMDNRRFIGNGFAAIQLNPESCTADNRGSKDGDLNEKRSLGPLPEAKLFTETHKWGQERSHEREHSQMYQLNQKDGRDDSQPSGSYSGRGVPAFVWLKVPKTMEITKAG